MVTGAFSVHANKLGNNLPCELKDIKDIHKFKKELKTHLFKAAYMDRYKLTYINKYHILLQ